MRIAFRICALGLAVLCGPCVRAQTEPPKAPSTLTVTSTLVVVPTLVRSPDGNLLHTLSAQDFKLLDNGIEQSISIEESERQPVAIVVLLQIGGAGSRQFASYAKLPTMLD
jgi:hypothetical protein